jgi:hypothetical protein
VVVGSSGHPTESVKMGIGVSIVLERTFRGGLQIVSGTHKNIIERHAKMVNLLEST